MNIINTYVFGNPGGWNLYEGDAAEIDYFKSFYVVSRRGSRLMVNRREDGKVVYAYVNYELFEGSERHGHAHFGMALVMDRGEYTPEFNKVYRFMEQLFHESMKQANPLFSAIGDGKYRYNVTKLDDAAECIEWVKSTLPRILDMVAVKSVYTDAAFVSGDAGRIATFADADSDSHITDKVILDGFRTNNWVAISPQFKKAANVGGADSSAGIELQEFELNNQHKQILKRLLDASTDVAPLSKDQIAQIANIVAKSLKNITDFLNSNPADKTVGLALYRDYSGLEQPLRNLYGKGPDEDVDPNGSGNDKEIGKPDDKNSQDDEPKEPSQPDEWQQQLRRMMGTDESLKLKAAIVAGIVIVLFFVVVIVKLVGEKAPESKTIDPPVVTVNAVVNAENFNNLIASKKFADAWRELDGKTDRDKYTAVLRDSLLAETKRMIVNNDNGLQRFYEDNKSCFDGLEFGSDLDLKLITLKEILAKPKITADEYNAGFEIAGLLGDEDIEIRTILNEKEYQSQSAVNETAKPQLPTVTFGQAKNEKSFDITDPQSGKDQELKFYINAAGYYVLSSTKQIKITSDTRNLTNNNSRTAFRFKIEKGEHKTITAEIKQDGKVITRITIEVDVDRF